MTSVTFKPSDFQLNPLDTLIILTPNINIQTYQGSLVTSVPIKQWDDGTTVTYSCVPGLYNVRLQSAQYKSANFYGNIPSRYSTEFFINVPETNGTGSVDAGSIIVSSTYTIPTGSFNVISASYCNTANTASFLLGSINSAISASYAATATSASYAPSSPSISASFATSASVAQVANSISGLIQSSSYSTTASYALNGGSGGTLITTGSTYPITSSWSTNAISASHGITSSYAQTASFVSVASTAGFSVSASYSNTASNAVSASYAPVQISASFATSASNATTASFLLGSISNAVSASYAGTASILLGSIVSSSYAFSASYAPGSPSISASYSTTASYALNGGSGGTVITTGSTYPITASWANNILSASHANTASVAISASYAPLQISASYATNATNAVNANSASVAANLIQPGSPNNSVLLSGGTVQIQDAVAGNLITMNGTYLQLVDGAGSAITLDENVHIQINAGSGTGFYIDGLLNVVTANGIFNSSGSLHGTSSWSTNNISSSHATTSSFAFSASTANGLQGVNHPGSYFSIDNSTGLIEIQDSIAGNIIDMSGTGLSLTDGAGSAITLDENGNISINSAFGANGFYISGSANKIITTGFLLATGSFNGTSSYSNVAGGLTPNTWSALTYSATASWAASPNVVEDRKTLILSGSSTLSISGLYNGWSGLLKTVQTGSAIYSLFLPSGTKVMNGGSGIVSLTTGSNATDLIGLSYDGSTLYAAIGNHFN